MVGSDGVRGRPDRERGLSTPIKVTMCTLPVVVSVRAAGAALSAASGMTGSGKRDPPLRPSGRNPFDDDRRRCMIRPTGLGISGTRVHTLRYVSAVLRTNSDLGLLGLGFGTSTDCLCGRLTGRESPKVTADT